MGEIIGLALTGTGAAAAGRRLARAGVRAGVPVDVVELRRPVREAARAVPDCLPASAAAIGAAAETPIGDAVARHSPTALLDHFRWRAWVAQAMGARLVVCPDATMESAPALAAMGLAVVHTPPAREVPGAILRSPIDALLGDRPDRSARRLADALDEPMPHGADGLDERAGWRALRALAGEAITGAFAPELHHTAAAVLDATDRTRVGVGIEGPNGPAVCAEGVAVAAAALHGSAELTLLAVVAHPSAGGAAGYPLRPPCPICREPLLDIAPGLRVVLDGPNGLSAVPLRDLTG